MATRVALALLVAGLAAADLQPRNSFMDRLNNGMKFAKDFLGSESVALKVAEFVVGAFQTGKPGRKPGHSSERGDSHSDNYSDNIKGGYSGGASNNSVKSPMSALRQVVRLFGLQPAQVSAVAVNALLFVAQMISTFLSGGQRAQEGAPPRDHDPASWILNKNSRRLQHLLAAARNETLPDILENAIKDQGSAEETSCIRLLVCKITPFVTKMQKTVFGEPEPGPKLYGAASLYRHLPSTDELNQRSDVCEKKHSDCKLN